MAQRRKGAKHFFVTACLGLKTSSFADVTLRPGIVGCSACLALLAYSQPVVLRERTRRCAWGWRMRRVTWIPDLRRTPPPSASTACSTGGSVEFDARSLPVPSLASWEAVTPTRYLFTLGEEGRSFSDGSRLSSEDVEATYASILDPGNASPHRALLSIIRDNPNRRTGPGGVSDFRAGSAVSGIPAVSASCRRT